MKTRSKTFVPASIIAGLAFVGLSACSFGSSAINHDQAAELQHATELPSNVPHGDRVNIMITGGAYGEFMNISCPDGTTSKNRRSIEAEFEATSDGVYIGFKDTIPAAIIIQGFDRGEAVYFPQSQTSLVPVDSLQNLQTPEGFENAVSRYCVA